MKYYGGLISGLTIPNEVLEKYGEINTTKQYRVTCKAKSRAEANRLITEITSMMRTPFTSDNCSETSNRTEIEMCDLFTVAIKLSNKPTSTYYDLKQVFEDVKEIKKTE